LTSRAAIRPTTDFFSRFPTPAVEVFKPDAEAAALVVCDHASNRIPMELQGLGLPGCECERHIAWDIGAAQVARRLAGRLDATAVLSTVSRLVIDCNRAPGDPTLVCGVSDGTVVPGNCDLADHAIRDRVGSYFEPYHEEISGQLRRIEQEPGCVAAVVAIHSFTPVMAGRARPWHVGVLWNRDPRLAVPLIDGLKENGQWLVGDNEPYSGRTANYTVDRHGGTSGRPHVSIEIRQDLIGEEKAASAWGDRLADILTPLLASPENRVARFY
jgi:predicted N-formylglutamate amidohydrolase